MNRTVLRRVFAAVALCCLLIPTAVRGQEPGGKPDAKAPASVQAAPVAATPVPATPAPHPDDDYWRKHDELLKVDFGWLWKCKEADAALAPSAKGENRVVFMGD